MGCQATMLPARLPEAISGVIGPLARPLAEINPAPGLDGAPGTVPLPKFRDRDSIDEMRAQHAKSGNGFICIPRLSEIAKRGVAYRGAPGAKEPAGRGVRHRRL